MKSLLSTSGLARASARHPWRVMGVWLLLMLFAGVSASGLSDVLTTEVTFLSKPEAVKGQDLLEERLRGEKPVTETVVIYSDDLTIDDPAFRTVIDDTTANLRGMGEIVSSATNYYEALAADLPQAEGLVSADGKATIIPVTLQGDFEEATERAEEYLQVVNAQGADGISVLSVGDATVNEAFNTISEEDLQQAEVLGLPIALVILVVVFGALVAAGVPIVLALISIFVSVGITAFVGRMFELSFFVVNMITMIGLAVGIDYSLFVIERYREERRRGIARIDAIAIAGGTASKAVVFSGLTVVLALLGMFIIPTNIFRSLGAGAIIVVLVAVAATLTLVPAWIALLGDKLSWVSENVTLTVQ